MPAEGGQGGTMGKLEGNGVMTCWNAYILWLSIWVKIPHIYIF